MRDSGLLNTPIVIGSTLPGKKSVLIPAGSWQAVHDVMPGGGTPGALTVAGQCSILNSCFDNYLTKQGKINNVLLSQTIALSLNVRIRGGILNNFEIHDGCVFTDAGSFSIGQNVVDYLQCTVAGTPHVSDLLALANALLGGVLTPGQLVNGCVVPTYSEVNDAVTAINEGFDECRTFLGYGPCPVTTTRTTTQSFASTDYLKVTAYPNPFTSEVRFTIQSTVSGQAQLEVYNMTGQRVGVAYSGYIQANRSHVVEYRAPSLGSNFVYILKVGGKQVSGKLLRLEY